MNEVSLCLDIISETFGEIVHGVALILSKNQPLLLHQIEQISSTTSKISHEMIKEALFVLIHHNHIFLTPDANSKSHFKYTLNRNTILYRLRLAVILTNIENVEGAEASSLLHIIATNGRVLLDQISDKTKFEKLKQKNYLSSVLRLNETEKPEEVKFVEKPVKRKASNRNQPAKIAENKKIEITETESSKNKASNIDQIQLFSINYNQFFIDIKRDLCIKYFSDRFPLKKNFIPAFFDRNQESNSKSLSSPWVKIVDLENFFRAKNWTADPLNMYLDKFTTLLPRIIKKHDSLDQYCIDYQSIFGDLQLQVILKIIKSHLDKSSARIFKILCVHGRLDEKSISDYALLPPKVTRTILYNLLSNNFIRIQEIPRRGDRLPSNCIFLYFVDMPSVIRMCIGTLYKVIVNLRKKHRNLGENSTDPLVINDDVNLKKLTKKMNTFLLYIVNLDEMVSILRDFIPVPV